VAAEYQAKLMLVPLAQAKENFLATKRGEGVTRKTAIKYEDWIDAFVAFVATRARPCSRFAKRSNRTGRRAGSPYFRV
jgi:hypothetical protein